MPYINKDDRWIYNQSLEHLIADLASNGWKVGHVTYVVYCIVQHWFVDLPGYQTISNIRGMLSGVLSEFDRRYAFDYEDEKIEENGDVYFTDIDREAKSPELIQGDQNDCT